VRIRVFVLLSVSGSEIEGVSVTVLVCVSECV
jgi:hypothetical protein